jgi:excinuclease ABC subunit C
MSVFVDGVPAIAEYRRYELRDTPPGDDYGAMREVLSRRFQRALEQDDRPDLLVVDGGRGQVGVALSVLQDLGVHDQPVVGISKPRTELRRGQRATDKLVLPHKKDPLRLPAHHPGLRLVQHLRDEAHRHALRYQRKVRDRKTLLSVLQAIPGIGVQRRKSLLKHLGSAEAVATATLDELTAVPGIGRKRAQAILTALDAHGGILTP